MLNPKRQSAQMSKIKNGGLDQYGKVQSFNGIDSERVKYAVYTCINQLYIIQFYSNYQLPAVRQWLIISCQPGG